MTGRGSGRSRAALGGFTLVESMVALLVLSIGLIGIAALHGQGLSASRAAVYRTIAINLSADMADRIRVNRLAGAAYGNAPADRGCGPGDGDCSPAELAEHDRFVWRDLVEQALPNGAGAVTVDAAASPAAYTITVSWDEVGEGRLTHTAEVQVLDF